MSDSNLPPEQWRPLFDAIDVEFGYRPLAHKIGMDHTRVRRCLLGGGTSADTVQAIADAFGVSPEVVRELRGESRSAAVEPFTLPDDAGRLTHDERNVVRAVVRALLDARDRHATDSPTATTPPAKESRAPGAEGEVQKTGAGDRRGSGTDPEGQAADDARPNVWREEPDKGKADDLIGVDQPSGVDGPAVDHSQDWRADEAARRAARRMREAPEQDRKVE